MNTGTCLFCAHDGPFTTVEHVIPESLGNDDLILNREVCDKCQAYFGTEVERFVLAKTPIAFWRTFLGIKTKKGRRPSVDLSQPSEQRGRIPSTHDAHDDGVGFTAHEDGSTSADIDDPDIIREILCGSRTQFRFVITPKVVQLLARFLLKVGIELLSTADADRARSSRFDDARRHARFGKGDVLWPVFHFSHGDLASLRRSREDESGPLEEIDCYRFWLGDCGRDTLFHFGMGADNWVVSLSERYPSPEIQHVFPEHKLSLLWYPTM